jgi:hypothetical protein
MTLSNNCKRTATVSATEILINGEKYFYRLKDNNKENIEIYKFNESLNGYKTIHNEEIKNIILKTL